MQCHGAQGGHAPPITAGKLRLEELLSLAHARCALFPAVPPRQLTPVSVPQGKNKVRRVKTIYDCQADNDDELTFIEGEVIVVTGEEDQEWWVRTHTRRSLLGLFPPGSVRRVRGTEPCPAHAAEQGGRRAPEPQDSALVALPSSPFASVFGHCLTC